MLNTKERINRQLFEDIMKNGRIFHAPHFIVRTMKADDDISRSAVVVSKKIARKAVDRNKLRRRVYAVARIRMRKSANTTYALFFTKKGAASLSYEAIEKELKALMDKAGLWS